LIEEGWVDHAVTQRVAHVYLDDYFYDYETGPDTLVLGCTHYPLIKPLLRRLAPEHIAIVDSAESTAEDVARQLGRGLRPEQFPSSDAGARRVITFPSFKFFATDSAEKFRRMGTRFLGLPVEDVVHVDLKE